MNGKRKILKKYSEIGALCRSSKFLYKKMTKNINFSQDLNIVEFGPGDGIFTDELLKQISLNSKISIFEINENFYKVLTEKYKNDNRVSVYCKNASQVKNFFKKESVDYIISSLPLAFIEKNTVLRILEKSKNILKSNGKFIQYQYFLQNKKQIKKYFPKIYYEFTFLNLPPAFVYICNK